MGYRCQSCGKAQPKYVKQNRVVIDKRNKTYPPRSYKVDKEKFYDDGGVGWEIAKEKIVCPTCLPSRSD